MHLKEKEEIRENFKVLARTLKSASTDNDGMDSLLLKLRYVFCIKKKLKQNRKRSEQAAAGKITKFSPSTAFLRMSKIYIMYPYANASFAIFTEKERIAMTM